MRVSRSVKWGDMLGMRKVETVEQMPDEYRQTLIKIIYALASTEFASVEQHQPWINKGPTPEDRYIQAQIAADEARRINPRFGPHSLATYYPTKDQAALERFVRGLEAAGFAVS